VGVQVPPLAPIIIIDIETINNTEQPPERKRMFILLRSVRGFDS
jgi:hypothetical protein